MNLNLIYLGIWQQHLPLIISMWLINKFHSFPEMITINVKEEM